MIQHIKYKGKKYPIRIGYKAIKRVNAELGRDFRQDEEGFDYEGAECVLYYGMQQGCESVGQTFDLKRDEMEDVLEESLSDFIQAFTSFSQDVQAKATLGVKKK